MPQDPQVTQIADYQNLCGECPVWDSSAGVLFWTDNAACRFYSFSPASSKHGLVCDTTQINGFRLNRTSGFLITNNTGIWLWDGDSRTRSICVSVRGAPCQVNDCVADSSGRLITTTVSTFPMGSPFRLMVAPSTSRTPSPGLSTRSITGWTAAKRLIAECSFRSRVMRGCPTGCVSIVRVMSGRRNGMGAVSSATIPMENWNAAFRFQPSRHRH